MHALEIIPRKKPYTGETEVPGDKSISHRSIMFASIADGTSRIRGFLNGEDCISTMRCFRQMGVGIGHEEGSPDVTVHGKGLHGLTAPAAVLYTGNSGTTTRLMSGILAGQTFISHVDGDASIRKRPMKRIMEPLSLMGASITSDQKNGCAPLTIRPAALHGISYATPVASAQVKSAILLAGLYADSPTTVTEPVLSRNHTENMLSAMGADLVPDKKEHPSVTIAPASVLHPVDLSIPGDISSAAYYIAAALLVPGSALLLRHVNTNPTRAGILSVCHAMGGRITVLNERTESGEETADLLVEYSALHGTEIGGAIIPTLIDEIPVLAVLAAFADGTTVIRDAAELRVKESDRIETITENLTAMGADVVPAADGLTIRGGRHLHGTMIHTHADHRIAMSFSVAGLALDPAEKEHVRLDDPDCADISWPGFYKAVCF